MKRLALVLFLTSAVLAQSRFDGTWEMKMDTLQFSGAPEDYLFENGMYHCRSCIPRVDVRTDGTDQRVTGHANFDTIAVRIRDANSIEFVMKKGGKPTFACLETVSADGQIMTEEFTNTAEAGTVTGKAGFTRVATGPAGSHALSGKWSMLTVKNATRAGTLTTFQTTPGGLKISDGSSSYEAKFDGKDYPVDGDAHSTASFKLIDQNTIEETDKRDSKVISVMVMALAKDGKSMSVEVSNKQRGQSMSYTAEKLP